MGEPPGVAPTLVEAYMGPAAWAAVIPPQPPAPAIAALVARCRALTATAAEAFQAAPDAHAQAPDAFEAARIRLLYGARLRWVGRRVAAREQLRAALDAFAAMDLTAWTQGAANELAATGPPPGPAGGWPSSR